jgi:hypothetical protein
MQVAMFLACSSVVGCTAHQQFHKSNIAHQVDDDEQIQRLLFRLDKDTDCLHMDLTPAVDRLIAVGEPAIRPTLPYLLSENPLTRLHASRVISGAIAKMHGLDPKNGWKSDADRDAWRKLCRELWAEAGDPLTASVEARQALIARISTWLESRN